MASRSEPTIAAALITKDSLGAIEGCLDSIRGQVDEICVYDTGSTDGTVEYLESLPGVRMTRGEWRDDFGWARQRSFDLVPADSSWIIWLDDDDVVEGAENLRDIVRAADSATDGLLVLYDYSRNENGSTVVQLWRERVVRRDRGFRWNGTVHEWLSLPDGRTANLASIAPDRLRIVHMRPAAREKGGRNLALLQAEAEAAEREGLPVPGAVLAYLGAEHMARHEYDQAMPLFEQYLQRGEGSPDERAQVSHRLARCLLLAGDAQAAVAIELASVAERDDWAETTAGLTEAYAALGEWDQVELWAKRTLELGPPRSIVPVNPLDFSFLPLVHLAEACFRTGRLAEGTQWLERAWAVR
jgi:tetratricopeptide (TPR) repeat protein